jgi:hypothetical protein
VENTGLIHRAKACWQRLCEMAPHSPQAARAQAALQDE